MAQIGAFPTRTAAVTDQIREDIVSRRLPPGTVIRDNELAERYGVSSSPVREALAQMQAERLVEILPNKTKFVSRIDRKSVRDFLEVHNILAEAGFSRGASRLLPEQLILMRSAHARMASAAKAMDAASFVSAARDLLDPVYRASDNAELRRHVAQHATWLRRMITMLEANYFSHAIESYGELLDHLQNADFTNACLLHARILEQLEQLLLELDLPD